MDKIFNRILFYTKIIFLLIAFTITLYILFMKMDTYELGITSILPISIPLLLVLIVFVFSFFFNIGKENMFFNIVCVLVLLAIIIIDYRTLFDNNIISKTKLNFNFFNISETKIKIMLYLTFISNILLIIYEKKNKIHS
jgi:hypothetical protein